MLLLILVFGLIFYHEIKSLLKHKSDIPDLCFNLFTELMVFGVLVVLIDCCVTIVAISNFNSQVLVERHDLTSDPITKKYVSLKDEKYYIYFKNVSGCQLKTINATKTTVVKSDKPEVIVYDREGKISVLWSLAGYFMSQRLHDYTYELKVP